MKFRQFWPLYLRAHTLPGTRAMHYVATAIGIMAGVEAVITQEPWILFAGITLAYGLAIAGHWFVEHNQPLIGVAPILGAMADLRMVWLAMIGRLDNEYAKLGLSEAHHSSPQQESAEMTRLEPAATIKTIIALDEFDQAARNSLDYYDRRLHRYALLFVSAVGLLIGLADLHDLAEPAGKPAYPIVQLGVPIIAFATALVLSYGATVIGTSQLRAILDWFSALKRKAQADIAATAEIDRLKRSLERQAARETSLRRASLAQFALGVAVFAAAEFAELIMAPAL